jgi:CRP-like cAMP-binding protein
MTERGGVPSPAPTRAGAHESMTHAVKLRCDSCPLGRTGLFHGLPRSLKRQLDADKVTHVLPAGRQLFDEGAPPLAVHCIHAGLVKVARLGPGGEEQIIRVLGPGEVVGYRAVLAGEPFSASALTLEETTVCTIPAPVLLALVRRSPDFALQVLAKVARELRISEDALVDLSRKTVRQRLAAVLLVLLGERAEGVPPAGHSVVRLARRDLAQLIATSPESVSRALRRFAEEGVLGRSRTEIRLLDLKALRRAAGDDPFGELISVK